MADDSPLGGVVRALRSSVHPDDISECAWCGKPHPYYEMMMHRGEYACWSCGDHHAKLNAKWKAEKEAAATATGNEQT